MDHEIIIVGAGPAGSASAITFARKGRRVLLMDQSEFPRDKPCGDAIAPSGVGLLFGLGLKEKIRQARFQTVSAVRLVSPGRRELRIRFHPADPELNEMIAPRKILDAMLRDRAVEGGAEFLRARATALVMENGIVAGVRAETGGKASEFRCRLLIGADGSGSTIARLLGGKARDPDDAVTVRGYFSNVDMDPATAEIHLLRDLWPGYAWIFPAGGGTANVGLGLSIGRYRKMRKNLKSILSDFLQSPGLPERFRGTRETPDLQTRMLKFYSPERKRRAFDGALLIGDAAALVNPLNGGGIVNALMSGILAADVADRSLAENDVSRKRLLEYEMALWKALGRELMISYRIKKMSSSPAVMETMMKLILANRKMVALAGRYYRDVQFNAE
jgi:geranylgeranyl reductase family protein